MTIDLPGGFGVELAGWGAGGIPGWLLGLIAAALLAALYRAERRRLSPAAGWLLLGLRLLAAALLLVLLAEPIATWPGTIAVPGRVILAVDRSASMDTADPNRPAADARKLAQVLGLDTSADLGKLARREIVGRLATAPAGPLRRLDHSGSLHARVFARDTQPISIAGLAELLRKPPPPDDPAAQATDWRPILAEAVRSREQSATAAPVLLRSGALAPVDAVVLVTDGRFHPAELTRGVSIPDEDSLADQLRAMGVPVFGLMIGSTVPPRDLAVAQVRAPGSVFEGDTATVEAELKLDGYAGQPLIVTLHRASARPGEKGLSIRHAFSAPARPSEGTALPRQIVRFQVPMDELGAIPITLAIAWEGVGTNLSQEARTDNNTAATTIQVSPDRVSVLLIDGEPRWELRYLRNALGRDPRVNVEAVAFRQPAIGTSPQPVTIPDIASGEPHGAAFASRLPERSDQAQGSGGEDPLSRFDVIVVGDVAPEDLPARFWKRLAWFVADRGGTLVLSPGPRHWPELASQPGSEEAGSNLSALLPVKQLWALTYDESAIDPAHPGLPSGIRVRPTPIALEGSMNWPMFHLEAPRSGTVESTTGGGAVRAGRDFIWGSLPGHPWVLVGQAKPGATVLATGVETGKREVAPPLASGDRPEAREGPVIMAAHQYGIGRVLWLGTNDTWRWRYRAGDLYHHRFWGQAVRWGAASSKFTSGNDRVRFGPLSPRINEGQAARIQARIAESVSVFPAELLLAARIVRQEAASHRSDGENEIKHRELPIRGKPGGGELLVPLRPIDGQPRVFQGDTPPLEQGSYLIRLESPGQEAVIGIEPQGPRSPRLEATLEVAPGNTFERIELAASREHLDRLAEATGGRIVIDAEAHHLVEAVQPHIRSYTMHQVRRLPLWDQPLTLIAFTLIITAEWLIRRRLGLP